MGKAAIASIRFPGIGVFGIMKAAEEEKQDALWLLLTSPCLLSLPSSTRSLEASDYTGTINEFLDPNKRTPRVEVLELHNYALTKFRNKPKRNVFLEIKFAEDSSYCLSVITLTAVKIKKTVPVMHPKADMRWFRDILGD